MTNKNYAEGISEIYSNFQCIAKVNHATGEIMFDDDYLSMVMESIKDIDVFLRQLDKLEELELEQIENFITTEAGAEIEDAFGNLTMFKEDEDNTDSITKYIKSRTEVTKKMVDVYFNFDRFKYLFDMINNYLDEECTLDDEGEEDIDE